MANRRIEPSLERKGHDMTHPTDDTNPPPNPDPDPDEQQGMSGKVLAAIIGAVALVVAFFIVLANSDIHWDNPFSQDATATVTATPDSSDESTTPAPPAVDDEEEIQPVVDEASIASCGTIWSWKSYDDCADKVAPWTPPEFDKSKDVSKLSYAQVEDWAKRFPNKDARVIVVYNDGQPLMDDEEVRIKAAEEAKLTDPSIVARLPIVRVERDFPGWYLVNTRNLEDKRMDPFRDTREEQVRVSLAPLDEKGERDLTMAGSGVFVTCFNKHWLEKPPPVQSTPPRTTQVCENGCVTTRTTTSTTSTPPPSTTTTTTTTTTTSITTSTTPSTAKPETSNPSAPPGITPTGTYGPEETTPPDPPSNPAPPPASPEATQDPIGTQTSAPPPETGAPEAGTTVSEPPPPPA